MKCLCVLLALLNSAGWSLLTAAEAAQPASEGNRLSLSSSKAPRAAWQQRFTLGPGDLLNISLFETADTARAEVPVGPDGRITYLHARDIMAAGLTIDELRAKLDEALGKFYQNPRTIITPAAYRSKKYLVMGAVMNKGVFTFDRPITLIEAIARAGGFETGLYESRSVEMADLSRSYLVRNGQHVAVDFEQLFRRGDLSQNVALQPDDFLYFPSALANEIYVLGEVNNPGVLAFAPKPTVLNAIAARGGYSPRAFKSRVLVVRGSLKNPQTFVIDTASILNGQSPDFKLQPKDIIYVSRDPWKIGVEVLDTAARSFLQALMVQTTTMHVPAAIK